MIFKFPRFGETTKIYGFWDNSRLEYNIVDPIYIRILNCITLSIGKISSKHVSDFDRIMENIEQISKEQDGTYYPVITDYVFFASSRGIDSQYDVQDMALNFNSNRIEEFYDGIFLVRITRVGDEISAEIGPCKIEGV